MSATPDRPLNVQRRVDRIGGWVGTLRGESQGAALERVLPGLNADGYRVAFVIPDKFSFGKTLLTILVAVCTLGIYWRGQGVLVIGERVDS